MDVFVARQPIFNTQKEIFAYELLFRSGMNNAFPDIDGDIATKSLLSSSFFTVGIDKIAGGKKAFINFTEELLLKNVPEMFPPEKIMVEILEDVVPTDSVVAACRRLNNSGFELALDDFVYREDYVELIELADIIKFDFLLTPRDELAEMVKIISKENVELLAEKIETYEEFELAKSMGFVYFQGYFFSKPEVLKNKDISSNKIAVLQLLDEVTKEQVDIDRLEELVNSDVSISYKLINYLNSAYFNRLQPISSIRQAIAYLGAEGLKRFISLVAIGQMAENKPHELIRTSIIRARFLQQAAKELGLDQGELFILGLFSLLDAILDIPLHQILEKMGLSDNLSTTLSSGNGEYGMYLKLIESYERGDWQRFGDTLETVGLQDEKVTSFYIDALGWADSFYS